MKKDLVAVTAVSSSDIKSRINFRDSLIKRLTDADSNSIKVVDAEVAAEVVRYKNLRSEDESEAEYLDEIGFFWDIIYAAVKTGADKTCEEISRGYKKDTNRFSNLLNVTLERDNVFALNILLEHGWRQEWNSKTDIETRLWSSLACKVLNWIECNEPRRLVKLSDLDSKKEKKDYFAERWFALSSSAYLLQSIGAEKYKERVQLFLDNMVIPIKDGFFGLDASRNGKWQKSLIKEMISGFSGHAGTVNKSLGLAESDSNKIMGYSLKFLIDECIKNGLGKDLEWRKSVRDLVAEDGNNGPYGQFLNYFSAYLDRLDLLKIVGSENINSMKSVL